MSPNLESKLLENYPILFRDRYKSPQETCMCWGVEFDNGWYKIFDDLCAYLACLSKNKMFLKLKNELKTEENKGYLYVDYPSITFTQVKEKYGTMRVYWMGNGIDNYDEIVQQLNEPNDMEKHIKRFYDKVDHAIDYTEFLSSRICEECACQGKTYTNGWYMTRCKKCIIEHYGFDPDEEQ